jgi:hypothetical protein
MDKIYILIHFCSWKLNSQFFNFLPLVWQCLNFMTVRTWKAFGNCHWRLCSHMFVNFISTATLAQTCNFITKWADESHYKKSYYTYQHIISQNIQAFMIIISLLWVSPQTAVLLASQLVRLSAWCGQHVRQTVVAVPATTFVPLIMESHRLHYMRQYITRMHIPNSHLITVDAKRVTCSKFQTEELQTLGAPVLNLVIMVNGICAHLSY